MTFDIQSPPTEAEVADTIVTVRRASLYHSNVVCRLAFERDGLRNLLDRFRAEVRRYCRPGMVQYDLFPVFKEVDDLFAAEAAERGE